MAAMAIVKCRIRPRRQSVWLVPGQDSYWLPTMASIGSFFYLLSQKSLDVCYIEEQDYIVKTDESCWNNPGARLQYGSDATGFGPSPFDQLVANVAVDCACRAGVGRQTRSMGRFGRSGYHQCGYCAATQSIIQNWLRMEFPNGPIVPLLPFVCYRPFDY